MAHAFLKPSDDDNTWLVLNDVHVSPSAFPLPLPIPIPAASTKAYASDSTPSISDGATLTPSDQSIPTPLTAGSTTSMPLTEALTAALDAPLPFALPSVLPHTPTPPPPPNHLQWLLKSCPTYRHTSMPRGQGLSPHFLNWLQSFASGTNIDPTPGAKLQSFEVIAIALLKNNILPSSASALRQELMAAGRQGVTFNRKKFKSSGEEVIWEALGGKKGKRFLDVRGGGRVLREGRGNYMDVGDIVLIPRTGEAMYAAGVVVTPSRSDYRRVRVAGLWEPLPESPPESPEGPSSRSSPLPSTLASGSPPHDCCPIDCSRDRLRKLTVCDAFTDTEGVDHVRGQGAVAIATLGALLAPCFPDDFDAAAADEAVLFSWTSAGLTKDKERKSALDFYKERVRRARESQSANVVVAADSPAAWDAGVGGDGNALGMLGVPDLVKRPLPSKLVRPVAKHSHAPLLRHGWVTDGDETTDAEDDDDGANDIWR